MRVEKFVADRIYAVCYYDAEQKYYYLKRFSLESGDKTQYFLDEGSDNRFEALTYRLGAKLAVEFGGQHSQRPMEDIDVDEFIGVKSHRAKGKRITTYEVAKLTFIEPEEPEEPEVEEPEMEDVDDNELATTDVTIEDVDVDTLLEEDAPEGGNFEPIKRTEGGDSDVYVAQLDLF
jgi:topoisomerase-4 subunit A